MFSKWSDGVRHAFALRLGLWYVAVFATSSAALLTATYVLLERSLAAQDHLALASTAERYADEYERGGLAALARTIDADAAAGGHDRLLVRVVGPATEIVYFASPAGWTDFDLSTLDRPSPSAFDWATIDNARDDTTLEVRTVRLHDGVTIQVGRSSEVRDDLLRHFRARLVEVLALITLIAALGGGVLTYVGLAPLRALERSLKAILHTQRFDSRVEARDTRDALDRLAKLFNELLGRIEALVTGMRGALDNVAHDLRTPLTRLRNVAESAVIAGDPESLHEGLVRALDEADRLNATLGALMDLSEAETGTMRLALEPVRLVDVVNEATALYADAAEYRGLALESAVDPTIVVTADRVRLRQVLANLIDNAVKYTDAGGHVRVVADASEGFVTISVHDTGIGLAPEHLPHIWDRLYRVDPGRETHGMGLGLSLVRAIVRAHHGHVAVRSVPGSGSVFSLYLPAATTPPAAT